MAGLISVQHNKSTKSFSVGQLDEFMDWAISKGESGTIKRQDLLKIALTFRAVDLIAGAVSRMPYNIYRGETVVTEKYEPRYWSDLLYKLCLSYLVFNQAYCLQESNVFGIDKWRFLVSPAVEIVTDINTGKLSGFNYTTASGKQPIESYQKRLLWWWWPNIMSEVGPGSGPGDAALLDATLVKYLTDFAASYFQRGGFPVTLVQVDGPVASDEKEKFESFWNGVISGVKRAFRAVLLSAKLKFTTIGSSIKDTTASELFDQAAENVAAAFGIPISMMLSNSSKYGNAMIEEHVRFITEIVTPIYNRMIEVWNERVLEPQNLKAIAEPERLEIMQKYEVEKAQALSQLAGRPVITVNEAREMMGYDLDADPRADQLFGEVPQQLRVDDNTEDKPDTQPEKQDGANEDAIEQTATAKHWAQFERKAHNALSAGKSAAVPFASDVLLAVDVEAARAKLEACRTHDEIKAAFAEARSGKRSYTIAPDLFAAAVAELKRANDALEGDHD